MSSHTHKLGYRLENTNIFEFPIKWARGCGLDPQNDSTHSEYLHSLLTTSTDFLQQKITTAAEWHHEHSGSELYKEALFHGHLCQEKAKQFRVSELHVAYTAVSTSCSRTVLTCNNRTVSIFLAFLYFFLAIRLKLSPLGIQCVPGCSVM